MADRDLSDVPVVVHIDDDADLLELTRIALKPLSVRFVGILRSLAGLETVRFLRPTLLLLDLMMPEMDGWDLMTTIKRDPRLRDLKVVLYSALADEKNIARGHASGADAFLTKPCTPARLREVVARMTGVPLPPERAAPARPAGARRIPPPAAPPGAPVLRPKPGSRPLPSIESAGVPGPVFEFVDRYLDTPVALELLTYLHDNPDLSLTVAKAARALSRKPDEIDPELKQLAGRGLLQCRRTEEGDTYTLSTAADVQALTSEFFKACEEPQVRVRALYRIIRRKTKFQ